MEVNFGAKPFMFDMEELLFEERSSQSAEIDQYDASLLV